METEEIVEIIQHYRHDVLNQLQVIQGYIGLQDYNKAESNMTGLLNYFQEERKLLYLNIPNVFLWFLQCRIGNANLKLIYDIDIVNKTLKNSDLYIVEKLTSIMEDIQTKSRRDHYYQVEVEFKDNIKQAEITVYIDLTMTKHTTENYILPKDIELEINENERLYRFYASIDNEVN